MPSVSVIIPAYNVGRYLPATLDSVLAQSVSPLEVIVIDDGSTDDTGSRIAPYLDRVVYLRQENRGAAVARNRGLDRARGDVVAFLDGDDRWEPDNLAIKTAVLSRHPEVGAVFSDFSIFADDGLLGERSLRTYYPVFGRYRLDLPDLFPERESVTFPGGEDVEVFFGPVFERLFLGNFVLTSTLVVRRSIVEETGRFVEDMVTQQDYEYFLRLARSCDFAAVDSALVRYRRHEGQLTDHRHIERIVKTVLRIVEGYREAFESEGKTRTFNRRKARSQANLAKIYVDTGRAREARRVLLDNFRLDPLLADNWLTFAVACLPSRLYRALRGR